MVLISINGNFNNRELSVLDRGVLFGESVYEVIPIHYQKPFQLEHHLQRLANGFQDVCGIPLDINQVRTWVNEYVAKMQDVPFHSVYVQLTSGSMPIRNHLPGTQKPTCIIHQTFFEPINFETYAKGFKAIAVADTRSSHACVKTIQLALNTQALKLASIKGYDDAVFIRDGYIVEAASSNVFAVIDDILITPPLDGIVPGLTRKAILEIAKNNHIPYEERPISLTELSHAQEVFLSSSIKLLKPLYEIENLFYHQTTFPIWRRIFSLYQSYIEHSLSYETLS